MMWIFFTIHFYFNFFIRFKL